MAEKMEDLMNLHNEKKENKNNRTIEDIRAEVLAGAKKLYDKKLPYAWGATGPNAYDCSGFTQKVLRDAGFKGFPKHSTEQGSYTGALNKNKDDLKPGDLVFFSTPSSKGGIGHVGIYIGKNEKTGKREFIHSSGKGKPCEGNTVRKKGCMGMTKSDLDSDYYSKHWKGGESLEKIAIKEKLIGKETTKNKPTISKSPSTSENTLTGADNQAVKPDAERLEKFYKYIFDVEGGYSNHKNDNGGATKYGIIEKEARKHGYTGDMRDFPKEMAKDIYKKDYYLKNRLNEVKDDRVALSVFDWAVNGGSSRAVKEVQKVLNEMNGNNDLAVDGIIGKYTLAALNGADPEKLLKAYQQAQSNFYDGIVKRNPSQKVFLKGWHNRLAKRENFIKTELAPSTRKNLSEVKNEFSSQAKTETNQKKMGNNIQKQR